MGGEFVRRLHSSTPKVSFSQPGVERGSASDTPGPVSRACDTEGVVQDITVPNDSFGVEILLPPRSRGVGRSALTPGCENDAVGVENQNANKSSINIRDAHPCLGFPAFRT